jgi:hypothetical protein
MEEFETIVDFLSMDQDNFLLFSADPGQKGRA